MNSLILGWIQGASVLIEKNLKKPLLWLPCRHHIAELLVGAAWYKIFGEDKAPYIQQFKEFKAKWNSIDKSKMIGLEVSAALKPLADQVITYCQNQLNSKKKIRDDYKESLELVLVCLGKPPSNYTLKLPGALSKARWMAILIYGIKIFLFRFELKKTKVEQKKLERFATFACLFYVKHWFQAPIAVDAPKTDLQLFHDMFRYKTFDLQVANAVLTKLRGHTWYINQEYVPLSLFSSIVSNEEKAEIANKLINTAPSKTYTGKVN